MSFCELSNISISDLELTSQTSRHYAGLCVTFFLRRINDKLSILRERDAHISNLEAEINEIVSKLNLLQNEKGKLMENEAVRYSQNF